MIQEIISREDAKAKGLSKFFTSIPCKLGHVAEQYTVNCKCVVCQRDEMRARYWQNPERFRAKSKDFYYDPKNREKLLAYAKESKKRNPSTKYVLRNREKLAGRNRPDLCELCNKPNTTKRPIYFDHCHQTGHFRGWICHRCNTVLGAVSDDADLLQRMANYVKGLGADNGG